MNGLSLAIQHSVDGFRLDVALNASNGVTGIIGPSGAGKSMLLRMIAGLERPTTGHIIFAEETLSDATRGFFLAPEHRRIGYVFQDALLFPHMSVAENLNYGVKRRGNMGHISRDDIIALLGLEQLLARRPHHLSGGEAQRVAIGRALLSNPRLLLMDEPLSSLDPQRRRDILPFIDALHHQLDLPIIYVSHNIDEITQLADCVMVLHAGQVAAQGNVADVLNQPAMQRFILGDDQGADDPAIIVEADVLAHDVPQHVTTLSFGAAQLSLPLLHRSIGSMVRLRIHARDIAIATERPRSISVQNIIETTVAEIKPTRAGQVEVILYLSDKHRLIARITKRASDTLALVPGMIVWALIKSVALASDDGLISDRKDSA